MAAEIASVNSLYMISGVSNTGYSAMPVKVQYEKNGDQYVSKLYLPGDKLLSGSNTYKLTVLSTIQDINGNNFTKNAEINFSGTDTVVPKAGVSEAVIISKDTIKIVFNKDIANDITNVTPSNYIIESSEGGSVLQKNPMFVSLISGKVVILKFDSLDMTAKYKLRITALKDFTGTSISFGTDANQIDVRMGR